MSFFLLLFSVMNLLRVQQKKTVQIIQQKKSMWKFPRKIRVWRRIRAWINNKSVTLLIISMSRFVWRRSIGLCCKIGNSGSQRDQASSKLWWYRRGRSLLLKKKMSSKLHVFGCSKTRHKYINLTIWCWTSSSSSSSVCRRFPIFYSIWWLYTSHYSHTHSQFGLGKQTQKPKQSGDREESTEKRNGKKKKQREDGCCCCYCCSTKTFKHNTRPKKNCNKKCEMIHTQKTPK